MSDSAAQLERDAEAARAQVVNTAESIKGKISPGQLIDEFTGVFTGGDGAAALNNLKGQIRDNPLPLTMIAAGMAWLMLGQGGPQASHDRGRDEPTGSARKARGDFGDGSDHDSFGEKVSELADSATSSLHDAAGGIAGTARSFADDAVSAVTANAGDLKDQATDAARKYGGAASRSASKAAESAQELLQREPLVVAALGLAIGTVIGAMLPSTELENEQFGEVRDKLKERAQDLVEKGVEGAKEVAAETYEAVKSEADRQGLTDDGQATLAGKAGEVLKTAAARAQETIQEKVSDAVGTK